MLSRRLFDDSDDKKMSGKITTLFFDTTPVKTNDIMDVVTPGIKRKLFLEPDEDSGLGMDDNDNLSLSAKRHCRNVTESNCLQQQKKSDDIKTVVNTLVENNNLVADGSRPNALPTIPGKHQDLKSITPQTLADVINGSYNNIIESFRIIDCRYPYEYEGGHVRGAENMYLHETILTLLQQPASERHILIFHCEFSSERGPKMLRFLRSKDREVNKENYPSLHYPEIYLLDSGYKAFFQEHPELCDPISYRPMLHSDHSADLRHFRSKSKSWTAGEKRRFARKAMRF